VTEERCGIGNPRLTIVVIVSSPCRRSSGIIAAAFSAIMIVGEFVAAQPPAWAFSVDGFRTWLSYAPVLIIDARASWSKLEQCRSVICLHRTKGSTSVPGSTK
jgi:hypothetical protein